MSKLTELMRYVAHKKAEYTGEDLVEIEWVLNVVYLADLEAYLKLGHSITGETWYAGSEEFPDTPSPGNLKEALEELRADFD